MLRAATECVTGIFTFVDPVMCPEQQNKKEWSNLDDEFADVRGKKTGAKVSSHVAEVLRQVQNYGIPTGDWVGGDAWFGP